MNQYLNFGAGNPVKGWINLDNSPFFLAPSIIHKLLSSLGLSKRSNFFLNTQYQYYYFSESASLPFSDNSLEAIYCSHFLEHLSKPENVRFFREAYRVLKKGGILRIVQPDLEKKIKLNQAIFSLEEELLTLPQVLKKRKIIAMLEAFHGFPSFHKTLLVKKYFKQFMSKQWAVSLKRGYLFSQIPRAKLKLVEQKVRTRNAVIFECIKQ